MGWKLWRGCARKWLMHQHLALWPRSAFQQWEGRRERWVPVISATPRLQPCPPILASTPPTLSLHQPPAHPGPPKGDQRNLWNKPDRYFHPGLEGGKQNEPVGFGEPARDSNAQTEGKRTAKCLPPTVP